MVSEKNKKELECTKNEMEKYPIIGILDLFKIPSSQLQSIKKDLRGQAAIKMIKKNIIERAFKDIKNKQNIADLNKFECKEPALIFSEINSFKLFNIIKKNKFPTYAKGGDEAPEDIIVSEGPTNLPAGPAIGELQRAKIPAIVKDGKISVKQDTVVLKKGEKISSQVANILRKLDIQPMEIGINLLGTWENNVIFNASVLNVDQEQYLENLKKCHISSLNLSVSICYPNKKSILLLIQKAFKDAKSLGFNARIFNKDVIGDLISKADLQTKALKQKINV